MGAIIARSRELRQVGVSLVGAKMTSQRQWSTALPFLALSLCSASAQGVFGNTMACTVSTSGPTVRAEGFSELVGDIVLTCTGGSALTYGSQVPQATITVFLNTA